MSVAPQECRNLNEAFEVWRNEGGYILNIRDTKWYYEGFPYWVGFGDEAKERIDGGAKIVREDPFRKTGWKE